MNGITAEDVIKSFRILEGIKQFVPPNPSDIWEWLPKDRLYRHTITGRTLGVAQQRLLSGTSRRFYNLEARTLANRLAAGSIDLPTWHAGMRKAIKDAYTSSYLMGRGGVQVMTSQDWGSIGGMLRNQYRYLDNFYNDIAMGNMSAAQIGARSELYINSATQAFERAQSRAYGYGEGPLLPAYPGDGSTVCLSNCACRWDIIEGEDEWLCYWRLGIAEHCPDCEENAMNWNPLLIPFGFAG